MGGFFFAACTATDTATTMIKLQQQVAVGLTASTAGGVRPGSEPGLARLRSPPRVGCDLAQERVHAICGGALHRLEQMRVEVARRGQPRMPERPHDDAHVDPWQQHERGGRVPEVVDADPPDLGAVAERVGRPQDVARLTRCADARGEHERIVGPQRRREAFLHLARAMRPQRLNDQLWQGERSTAAVRLGQLLRTSEPCQCKASASPRRRPSAVTRSHNGASRSLAAWTNSCAASAGVSGVISTRCTLGPATRPATLRTTRSSPGPAPARAPAPRAGTGSSGPTTGGRSGRCFRGLCLEEGSDVHRSELVEPVMAESRDVLPGQARVRRDRRRPDCAGQRVAQPCLQILSEGQRPTRTHRQAGVHRPPDRDQLLEDLTLRRAVHRLTTTLAGDDPHRGLALPTALLALVDGALTSSSPTCHCRPPGSRGEGSHDRDAVRAPFAPASHVDPAYRCRRWQRSGAGVYCGDEGA